jgi:transcriptional regulator with PAS, ATPase and Fis domain
MVSRVLILDRVVSPCRSAKCDSFADVLHRSLRVDCTAIGCEHELPSSLSFIPDLIILRTGRLDAPNPLVRLCKRKWCETPVLLLVCCGLDPQPDIQTLVDCDDFSYCPYHEVEFLNRVRCLLKAFAKVAADKPNGMAKETLHFGALVGTSHTFLRAIADVKPMAESDATILISGQTGTGKELFSRAIHYQSRRHDYSFVPVNCAALPDQLFENELFGHAKGAYTDASSAEKGLIAEAEGGTLVLDEIDTLSLVNQAKLLRFLQDREYRPVGSSRPIKADLRVIASTNSDLLRLVEAKQFRDDLYYRLNSLSLSIPPLRDRIEDVAPLTSHFLTRFARENGRPVAVLSPLAMDKLMAYSWPGNVRELESVMIRALTFSRSPVLKAEDIQLPSAPTNQQAIARPLREAKTRTIETFERRYLLNLLTQHQGNVTRAAKAAGKERRAFQRLLRKHQLDRQSFVSEPALRKCE